MKKKLLGILSLVLCLGMLLTSCSKGGKAFNEVVVDPYVNENPVLTAFVEDKVFDGEDVQMNVLDTFAGRYVVFNNATAEVGEAYIALYDAKDSKVIKSWNKPVTQDENLDPVSYTDIATKYGEGIYGVIEDNDDEVIAFYVAYKHVDVEKNETTYTYTVYNLDNSEVYTEDIDNIYNFSLEYDVFKNNLFINGCQYKIGAKLTKVESYNKFTKLPDIDDVGEEYIYDEVNGSIVIYDFDYNKVGVYTYPAVHNSYWHVLQNGNILFTGENIVPENEDDYDYLARSNNYGNAVAVKYNTVYELYNVAEDKTEKLDFDNYIVEEVGCIDKDSDFNVYGGKYANLVVLVEIQDKIISESGKVMAMDNEGKLEAFPEVVPNQIYVADSGIQGRYLVYDMNEDCYLVDGNGKVLGDWSKIEENIDLDEDDNPIRNDSYFVSDDVIYDWNLTKIADIPEDYILTGVLANGFMFASRTEDEVAAGEDQTYTIKSYVFKNGAFTELTSYKADEYSQPEVGVEAALAEKISDQLYIVQKVTMGELGMPENAKIAIYNENGTLLKEFTDIDLMSGVEPFDIAVEAEDGSYVLLYSADGTVYKVAAAAQSVGA